MVITIGAAGGAAALDVASSFAVFPEVPANVTLGPLTTIQQAGAGTSAGLDTSFDSDTLTNQGIINAGASGGLFTIGDTETTFNNSGKITVSNGDTLTIAAETLANSGTVSVLSGATLNVGQAFNAAFSYTSTPAAKLTETNANINLNGQISVANLNGITRSGGTITIASGATADLHGGILNVGSGSALGAIQLKGTLQDGIVHDADIGLIMEFGAIQNIVYRGTMDLSPANSSVTDLGGLTFSSLGGAGPGVVLLEGSSSALDVAGTQTLDNVVINIGNNGFFTPTLASIVSQNFNVAGSAPNLTLGSKAKINDVGTRGLITATANFEVGGGTITNAGIINATYSGGTLNINGTTFINQGTVTVSNGDDLVIQTGSFINTGTVTVTTGGILDIGGQKNSGIANTFNSTGVLNENGGTINMNGTVSFANYAQITRTGGVVAMNGTSDLKGNTLNVGSGSALGALMVGGVITDGTIHDADPGLVMNGGTLLSVTDRGTLDMTNSGAVGTLAGAIALAGLSGSGAFTLLLEGAGALLTITATSLSNTNMQIGSANGNATLLAAAVAVGVVVPVTLANNFTITHAAGGATLSGMIVDNGSITAAVNGGLFNLNGLSFTNNSIINVDSFDTMNITAANFVNNGTVNIASGGIVNLGAAFAFGAGGSWSGSGPINLVAGTLNIFGTPALASLNTVKHTGGFLNFFGATNLGGAGKTLDVGAGTPLALILDGGTFTNGTIHDNGNGMEYIAANAGAALGGLLGGTAKFTNITYQGVLDLSETGAILTASNLTVTSGAGTGNGVVELTAPSRCSTSRARRRSTTTRSTSATKMPPAARWCRRIRPGSARRSRSARMN